jgi:hypothetical protein
MRAPETGWRSWGAERECITWKTSPGQSPDPQHGISQVDGSTNFSGSRSTLVDASWVTERVIVRGARLTSGTGEQRRWSTLNNTVMEFLGQFGPYVCSMYSAA